MTQDTRPAGTSLRFAFFSPPFLGHLNPMRALAEELVARGHEATFVAQRDAAARLAHPAIGFSAVGSMSHPAGSLAGVETRMADLRGGLGLRGVIADLAARTDMLVREGVAAVRAIDADAIVSDQLEPAGALIARHLDLPYVSVANALLVNREPNVPPPFLGWRYDPTGWGRWRNRGGYRVADLMMKAVGDSLADCARRLGLPGRRHVEDWASPLAEISQSVPGLDYPRHDLPSTFHHCGPLRSDLDEAPFALPRDGRPRVFASLGSLQGGRAGLFRVIAQACHRQDLALVLAHGGRLSAAEIAALPGRPAVYDFVPQRAVLDGAAVAITNAGLNTVLDALSAGVPILAIPIAFEQSAIAARLEWAGIGRRIGRHGLTGAGLAQQLDETLGNPGLRARAGEFADEIAAAGGVSRAADIVEAVARSGRPVTREMLRTPERIAA